MNHKVQQSPVLNRVISGELCSGCGACVTIAGDNVAMAYSQNGFLRPVQSGRLVADQERRIAHACPGIGLELFADGRPEDPLWGPFLGMYSGYATDPELRHRGSSGGVLSALLVYLLQSDKVDHVLQVAADLEIPIGNRTVLTSDADGVAAAAGSRYAPSAPLAAIEPHLDSDLRFAFVGKPCDVAALQAMKSFDPRIAERIPYMLSFFCAGVPSLDGAREVLGKMGLREEQVKTFRFRGNGWPGMARADLRDGGSREMSYADSWGGILSRHVQFRCKICPDGIGSYADVVCADAWDADEKGYPIFEEREGISLAVGRTKTGEALLKCAVEAGHIVLHPFNCSDLSQIQPGQRTKRQFVMSRLLALRLLGRPFPKYRGFHLWRNALAGGVLQNLRNFLGTLRRAVMRRL